MKGFNLGALRTEIHAQVTGIIGREAQKSAERIRKKSFGPRTTASKLQIRSGDAQRAIGVRRTEVRPTLTMFEIGVVRGTPKIDQYMETQEIGRTITPTHGGDVPWHNPWDKRVVAGGKLAFPPGDATSGARDARGVQVETASSFKRNFRSLGYTGLRWSEGAIHARRGGAWELIFIRAASVRVPARMPVGRDVDPTAREIDKQLDRAPAP